jgi:tetratricopeptide (TPR) repeat protein
MSTFIPSPARAADTSMACFTAATEAAARLAACAGISTDTSLSASVRANALVTHGTLLEARGDTNGARADYDAALALTPGDGAVLLARGKLHERSGETAKALADYSAAIAAAPNTAEAYARRGLLRLDADDTKDVAQALADITQARRLSPRDENLQLMQATAQLRAERTNDAIATFTALLAANPSHVEALRGRAMAFGRLGKFDDALDDLNRLLLVAPGDEAAAKARGVAALQAGKYLPAIGDFSDVLAKSPRDAETLFFRGTALFRAGDIQRAEADFDAVLALRPDDPDALAGRGLARLTDGRLMLADADFSRALVIAPRAGALLLRRGQLRVLRGDNAAAARDLTVAMTTDAASPEVAVWLAFAQRGEKGAAIPAEARKRFADNQWPMPILRHLRGDISADSLMTAAGDDAARQCEASYALGLAALWRNDNADATRRFAGALNTGARGDPAFIGAKIELTKLTP